MFEKGAGRTYEVLEASFEDSQIGLEIFPNQGVEGESLISTSGSNHRYQGAQ